MEPTNVLIRVCILLLMQPAPLAGTATPPPASKVSFFYRCSPRPLRGRQPTPGNVALKCACRMQPAPLTGTTTHGPRRFHTGAHQQDATRTPRGDGNRNATTSSGLLRAMQPAPLAGTATNTCLTITEGVEMQPAPLTGTATIQASTISVWLARCNPHPLRGRQLNGVLVELLVVQM